MYRTTLGLILLLKEAIRQLEEHLTRMWNDMSSLQRDSDDSSVVRAQLELAQKEAVD